MSGPRAHGSRKKRCGGILFEAMLALALFAGAAAFTLGAVRSVFDSFGVMRRRQEAVDLARTKIAELEAGIISLTDLRSGMVERDRGESGLGWTFELKTHRTAFTGLTLIELTVLEDQGMGVHSVSSNAVSFTLRQLVALREDQAPEYEQDELAGGNR
jgi:hypothetical protein